MQKKLWSLSKQILKFNLVTKTNLVINFNKDGNVGLTSLIFEFLNYIYN